VLGMALITGDVVKVQDHHFYVFIKGLALCTVPYVVNRTFGGVRSRELTCRSLVNVAAILQTLTCAILLVSLRNSLFITASQKMENMQIQCKLDPIPSVFCLLNF